MHPRVIAQRTAEAQARTQAAAEKLAACHGLEASLTAALSVYDRDPDTRAVMRQEAVAELLEALVEKQGPSPSKPLEEVPQARKEAQRLSFEAESASNGPLPPAPVVQRDLGPSPPRRVEGPAPTEPKNNRG